MKAHLEAVEVVLSALGYITYRWSAPEWVPQYVVLEAPGWGADFDASIGDAAFTATLRIKAVAGTGDGVSIMLSRIRETLDGSHPVVAGRSVTAQFDRAEFIGSDPEFVIPTTDRHPSYGVDSYSLISEAIA